MNWKRFVERTGSSPPTGPGLGRDAGFTLVEVLVVIAIIGVLVAMLLPALSSARTAARITTCRANLHQLSLAAIQYSSANQELPALWKGFGLQPWENFSWRVEILPFIEATATFDQIDTDVLPLDSVNSVPISDQFELFLCPTVPGNPRIAESLGNGAQIFSGLSAGTHDYVAVHDVSDITTFLSPLRGIWNGSRRLTDVDFGGGVDPDRMSAELRWKPPRVSRVLDGMSNTVLLIEQAGKPQGYVANYKRSSVPPTEGAWSTGDFSSFFAEGINTSNYTDPYAFHPSATAAMGDGAVVSLSAEISPAVLVGLLSRAGNEILSSEDWQ